MDRKQSSYRESINMEVIKAGTKPSEWSGVFDCKKCHSQLRVYLNDLRKKVWPDYGPREPGWTEYGFTCVFCREKNSVSAAYISNEVRGDIADGF